MVQTSSTSSPASARPSGLQRYGPIIGIVVVIAVIVAMVVITGRDGSSDTTSSAGSEGSRPGEVGLTGLADVPMTYAEAKAQGKEGATTWVDDCDPATGRL